MNDKFQRMEEAQENGPVERIPDHVIRERNYQKLLNQISIYSGRMAGGLSALQDLYHKLKDGEKIVCECCGHRIDKGGRHRSDCMIVEKYEEVFNQ